MISEGNLSYWAERYLNNQLTLEELEKLNEALEQREALRIEWKETLQLLQLLQEQKQTLQFRHTVESVQQENRELEAGNIITTAQKRIMPFLLKKSTWAMTGIAAALCLLTALSTFWMLNHRTKTSGNQYMVLKREVENIKHSQSKMLDSLYKQDLPETSFGGSGFAVSNNGYVATNYHVVKGAKNIYIQTADGISHKSYVIAVDPVSDVALLKIQDNDFRFTEQGAIPYVLSENISQLGESMFTLGYPQDELVYNKGYISSALGFNKDSGSYQLDISANPGQSGAPVFDENGKIVALITGKQSNTSGATYAVHANVLLQIINSLPEASKKDIVLKGRSTLKGLNRVDQIQQLRPYMCMVKVN